jgi:hypothetical protein
VRLFDGLRFELDLGVLDLGAYFFFGRFFERFHGSGLGAPFLNMFRRGMFRSRRSAVLRRRLFFGAGH